MPQAKEERVAARLLLLLLLLLGIPSTIMMSFPQNIQFRPEYLTPGDIVHIDLHGEAVVAV